MPKLVGPELKSGVDSGGDTGEGGAMPGDVSSGLICSITLPLCSALMPAFAH